MPRVTVIVPVYNCAMYVAAAVKSVLDQVHGDFELIIVDDGSTDGSIATLAPYRHHIRLIAQENSGVAAARNAGLRAANGDYVAFLDADDWWVGSRLSTQLAALKLYPDAGLVFSDFCVEDASGEVLRSAGIRWKYRVLKDAIATSWDRIFTAVFPISWVDRMWLEHETKAFCGRVYEFLFQGNFINTSSVLVRRDALIQVGGFDESLGTEEDYDCWLKIARDWPFVFVDAPLVGFRRRPDQLTRPDQLERVYGNVMRVVQNAADRSDGAIDSRAVKARLSVLRRDIGVICLRTGRRMEARGHFRASLRQMPNQVMTYSLLGLSFLPIGLFQALENVYRALRRRLRHCIS